MITLHTRDGAFKKALCGIFFLLTIRSRDKELWRCVSFQVDKGRHGWMDHMFLFLGTVLGKEGARGQAQGEFLLGCTGALRKEGVGSIWG